METALVLILIGLTFSIGACVGAMMLLARQPRRLE